VGLITRLRRSSAQLGGHLAGDDVEVVEIGEVQNLEEHPAGAALAKLSNVVLTWAGVP
jgi:hypothetical protein